MKLLLRLCPLLVIYCVVSRAEHTTHKCIAGSETFVCTLPSFLYNPEENVPQFHLPKDVNAIRFARPFYYTSMLDTTLSVYDGLLHKQLNSPKAIEIRSNRLSKVEIQPNLEYADFATNRIQKIIAPSNQSYALRYLNLSDNPGFGGSNIVNISKFVNLETLYMAECYLMSLPEGLFDNMNRLKRLDLTENLLTRIDLSVIPSSLTTLQLENNEINSFTLPSGHLPMLEEFMMEYNHLKDVDVSALLAMAPKLKLIALGHNPIKRDQLVSILDELDQRKVAYYDMELPKDSECLANERKFRGVCIPESSFPLEAGDWVEIVLLVGLLIVVLIGGVFVAVKLWTKYHPSWKAVSYFNRNRHE